MRPSWLLLSGCLLAAACAGGDSADASRSDTTAPATPAPMPPATGGASQEDGDTGAVTPGTSRAAPITPATGSKGGGSGTSAAAGAIRVRGVLTAEGAECPALRGMDGTLYTLTPRDLQGHRQGDTVQVTGTIAEMSTCMQGTTIGVTRIEKGS